MAQPLLRSGGVLASPLGGPGAAPVPGRGLLLA